MSADAGDVKLMDTKATLAAVVVVAVLIVGFFLVRPTSTPTSVNVPGQNSTASSTSQTSESATTSTKPPSTTQTAAIQVSEGSIALFSASSFTSTSTYPTVTGIANTAKVGIIVNNSKGVGIVGTADIPVVQGNWSYSTSVALTPGTYTLVLFVGKTITQTVKLTVVR